MVSEVEQKEFNKSSHMPVSRIPLKLGGDEDRLFENQLYPHPFEFNAEVAGVFDNMVSRSVPMYREVNHSIVEWACLSLQENDLIYDLGCSTGTTLLAIGQQARKPLRLVGVDQSEAMLNQAREKLSVLDQKHQVRLLASDLSQFVPDEASFIIMNYTLQFIPVARRRQILEKIYESLRPGGIFYFSEKICSPVPEIQEVMTCSYEHFKRRQGYSNTEIERKKEALDQVLIPFTMGEHIKLLQSAGFEHFEPVLKWNQFVSYVAVKK